MKSQQATGNRQQATGNRQQATGNRQQYYTHPIKYYVNYQIAIFYHAVSFNHLYTIISVRRSFYEKL